MIGCVSELVKILNSFFSLWINFVLKSFDYIDSLMIKVHLMIRSEDKFSFLFPITFLLPLLTYNGLVIFPFLFSSRATTPWRLLLAAVSLPLALITRSYGLGIGMRKERRDFRGFWEMVGVSSNGTMEERLMREDRIIGGWGLALSLWSRWWACWWK